MDFTLVVSLLLTVLRSTRQILVTEQKSDLCFIQCPPGYHTDGKCSGSEKYKCKKCDQDEYMNKDNSLGQCLRCDICEHNQQVNTPCNSTSNTVCECIPGYYEKNGACKLCGCKHCNKDDHNYTTRCDKCRSGACVNNTECKRQCEKPPQLPHSPTHRTTPTRTSASTNSSDVTLDPLNPGFPVKHMLTMILVAVVATFLVLFGFLLLTRYPCWSVNKDLKPPVKDNEQRSQGSSPTTLSITISEETPIMTFSPAAPDYPSSAHNCPNLPKAERTAHRQEEHFPAIILYAIIKEVPLRRWKEFLRLLSVSDHQLERVEMEAGFGLGSIERQYQMLKLWSLGSSASMEDVFSALHDMGLSGCAQQLQESLDKLKWRPAVN